MILIPPQSFVLTRELRFSVVVGVVEGWCKPLTGCSLPPRQRDRDRMGERRLTYNKVWCTTNTSLEHHYPMSRKQVKATKKPVVQPKRPKAKPKTSRDSTRAWAVNSGIVISDVIVNVAQYASLLGIQHAAQAASLVFTTIQVCGGTSFNLCIEAWASTSRMSRPTKKTSSSSLMMPRNLSSLYGAYKGNLKIRRNGHLLR